VARRPAHTEWPAAVEALVGLVREDYPREPMADLAATYLGVMFSEPAHLVQIEALRVVESFCWPEANERAADDVPQPL
jgi:hypothetical protein